MPYSYYVLLKRPKKSEELNTALKSRVASIELSQESYRNHSSIEERQALEVIKLNIE